MITNQAVNKKSVFLTGADGLLGSNLCHELTERGFHVVAFIEKGKDPITIKNLSNLTLVEGDILDAESLVQPMTGCNYIIHAAANTTVNPARSPIIVKVNLDGTKNLLQVAEKTLPEKIIIVGTANSFTPGTKENPGKEGTPYTAQKYNCDYMDSKYNAHVEAITVYKTKGLPVLTVHPTFMLGPYDSKPSSGSLIVAVYKKKTFVATNGGKNYVHVRDVANAIVNALEIGKIGESYILGNRNMSYLEAFRLVAETVGGSKPILVLPGGFTLTFGKLCDFIQWVSKRHLILNYAMCKISCDDHYYSSQKAVSELGMRQTHIDLAIKESFDWMKANMKI
jgi:dihydroflavonol-4-reductase